MINSLQKLELNCFLRFRLITWPEVRMSVGNSFLSQGHRPTSANKVHSKDDWLRQVNYLFLIQSILINLISRWK